MHRKLKLSEMTKEAAARIQSATARKNDGVVPKESFAARAQAAAVENERRDKE